jgi:quinol monooxygenase YgiN
MVSLEILVRIPSTHRQEFMQTFEIFSDKQKDHRQASSGACLDRSIFECIGSPNCFLWIEKWADPQSLEAYMKTDRFKALLGAIQVLGELDVIHRCEMNPLMPGEM